eukprot:TRINITY_DN1422_c0_g3_i2.p1 TRINITY_DN1422_c0_g3~~TRINITY_DN1422_c0_g3_i2.p1  ORF type:complete len:318 (+),score=52.27 TRINITY_DN1422_c0_g3_i2:130-1083(+)
MDIKALLNKESDTSSDEKVSEDPILPPKSEHDHHHDHHHDHSHEAHRPMHPISPEVNTPSDAVFSKNRRSAPAQPIPSVPQYTPLPRIQSDTAVNFPTALSAFGAQPQFPPATGFQTSHTTLLSQQMHARRIRATSYPLRQFPTTPVAASDSLMRSLQQQQQNQLLQATLTPTGFAPTADAHRIYLTEANYDAEGDDRPKSWKWVQHSDRSSKTKRLPNAYMVFCNKWREVVRSQHPDLDHRQVTSKLGEMWRVLDEPLRHEYHEQAKILQQSTMDVMADPASNSPSSDEMDETSASVGHYAALPTKESVHGRSSHT